MAAKSVVLLTVAFSLTPSSSLTHVTTPDCEGIQVLCNLPIRSCCNGQCCPFLKEFQLEHVDLPPLGLTASQYAYEWLLQQPNQDLPKLDETCLSSAPEQYQCTDSSMRCRFDGETTSEGILVGKCKINRGEYGCENDAECYHHNDMCKKRTCVERTASTSTASSAAKSNKDHVNELELDIEPQREVAQAGTEQTKKFDPLQQWDDLSDNAQAAIIFGGMASLVVLCIIVKCCYLTCGGTKKYQDDKLRHVDRKSTEDDVSYDVEHGVSAVNHVDEDSTEEFME